MLKNLFLIYLLISSYSLFANEVKTSYSKAILHTSRGDITIKFFPNKAPISVQNFIDYAKAGFYNGTIFHRVKKRFVIQGGGFEVVKYKLPNGEVKEDLARKPVREPIKNESGNGLYNDRWTVAMARTDDPDSATSQFYINLRMNNSLDKRGSKAGYAVFAEVTEGKHVAQDISKQQTKAAPGFDNLPIETITIESVELL